MECLGDVAECRRGDGAGDGVGPARPDADEHRGRIAQGETEDADLAVGEEGRRRRGRCTGCRLRREAGRPLETVGEPVRFGRGQRHRVREWGPIAGGRVEVHLPVGGDTYPRHGLAPVERRRLLGPVLRGRCARRGKGGERQQQCGADAPSGPSGHEVPPNGGPFGGRTGTASSAPVARAGRSLQSFASPAFAGFAIVAGRARRGDVPASRTVAPAYV